jgi:hypothetical protein
MVDWSMAHGASNSDSRSAIFFMLLSAGIFGYFGFSTTWLYTGVNGQFLLFVALLDWTLKITAVAFGLAVVLTFILPWLGHAVYAVFGLLGAIMFVVVAILDIMDTQHTAMSPLLLFIFAAWTGYGSWTGLQEVLSQRAASAANDPRRIADPRFPQRPIE